MSVLAMKEILWCFASSGPSLMKSVEVIKEVQVQYNETNVLSNNSDSKR